MKTILFYAACLFASHAKAFVAPPMPLAFTSDFGSVIFTMIPEQYGKDFKVEKTESGVAYEVQLDGTIKVLYRTEGWYSYEVFISRDGRYLVRMGDLGRGSIPRKEDLAVAFYENGKLIKEYSTADLVEDTSKVIPGAEGGYVWRYRGAPQENGQISDLDLKRFRLHLDYTNTFTIYTIDGWIYTFDATTGKIKSKEKLFG